MSEQPTCGGCGGPRVATKNSKGVWFLKCPKCPSKAGVKKKAEEKKSKPAKKAAAKSVEEKLKKEDKKTGGGWLDDYL